MSDSKALPVVAWWWPTVTLPSQPSSDGTLNITQLWQAGVSFTCPTELGVRAVSKPLTDLATATAEIARLTAERDALRKALTLAQGALLQCSPCMEPECKADQEEWLQVALANVDAALRPQPAPDLRPPGGERFDDGRYVWYGLTADHVCRMWARYVDQTHPPPPEIANLIIGVTADVRKALIAATANQLLSLVNELALAGHISEKGLTTQACLRIRNLLSVNG